MSSFSKSILYAYEDIVVEYEYGWKNESEKKKRGDMVKLSSIHCSQMA